MTGTIEAGAKVATSTVEAMKSQPLAIALIIINVLFLATMIWVLTKVAAVGHENRVAQDKLIERIMADCMERAK